MVASIVFMNGYEMSYKPYLDLSPLAPVLVKDRPAFDAGLTSFAQFLSKNAKEAIMQAQMNDLTDVWSAFERHYQTHVQASEVLLADDMRSLFQKSSTSLNVIQLQEPIITDTYMSRALSDELNRTAPDYQWRCDHMDVGGAPLKVFSSDEGETYETTFCFVRVVQSEKEKHSGAIFAVPLIMIDSKISKMVDFSRLRPLLQAFQHISAVANHDYYHQITGRVMFPYFDDLEDFFDKTPYAQAHNIRWRSRVTECVSETYYGGVSNKQDYKGAWSFLSPDNDGLESYEFLAAFMQASLYTDYLDDTKTGEDFKEAIDHAFDSLLELVTELRDSDQKQEADICGFYFSSLLMMNIVRVVNYDHPIVLKAENWIDRLSLSSEFRDQYLVKNRKNDGATSAYVLEHVKKLTKNNVLYLWSNSPQAQRAREESLTLTHEVFSAVKQDLDKDLQKRRAPWIKKL